MEKNKINNGSPSKKRKDGNELVKKSKNNDIVKKEKKSKKVPRPNSRGTGTLLID